MTTEADKPNNGALATICAVLFLSVLGIALAVTALVRTSSEDDIAKKSVGARVPFDELSDQQRAELGKGFEWTNRDAGLATVPLERAMGIVIKNIQNDPESATPPAPAKPDGGADAEATSDDAGVVGEGGEAVETDDAGAPGSGDPGAPPEPKTGAVEGQETETPTEAPKLKVKPPKPAKVPGGPPATEPAPPPPAPEPGTGP